MTESADTAKPDEKYALVIQEASHRLQALADDQDEEFKQQILALAQLTSSEIKGVEGTGTRPRIPELRMRQPMSGSDAIPEDCKPGQFYISSGGSVGDDIKFIPILRHALRKKWSEENRIDCMSLDGETGTRYGKCADCPYSKFVQGQQMDCSPGHSFYVVTPELDAIYRVDFQKSSAKAGRNILRLTTPPALWAKSFTLSTQHNTGNSRNYYNMVTKPTGEKTSDEVMEICELLHEFFHAQYQQAKADLNRFNDNAQATGEAAPVVAESDGDTISFEDGM